MKHNILITYFILAILASILIATPTIAATYYIDTNGSDAYGTGSPTSPWESLSYACSKVKDFGDTIHMNSGVFTETGQCKLAKGINLEGSGSNKTIVKSSLSGWLITLESSPVSNGEQILKDFKIDGLNRQLDLGILVKGRHNIKIHDVEFENIDITGLEIIAEYGPDKFEPPTTYLTGIEIYNIIFKNCSKDFPSLGWSGGNLQIGHLEGGLIHDIIISEDRGYGIKFWQGGWFKRTKIYNNTIMVPSYDPIWGSDIAIELWNLYDGCEIYNNLTNNWLSFVIGNKGSSTKSVRIYQNNISFERDDNPKEGIEIGSLSDTEVFDNYIERPKFGIAIWDVGNGPSNNNMVRNNVFYNKSNGDGVLIRAGNNNEIYNNVFDSMSSAMAINNESVVNGTRFKNNIVINCKYGVATMGKGAEIKDTEIMNNVFYKVDSVFTEWGGQTFNTTISESLEFKPALNFSGIRPDHYYRPTDKFSNVVDAGTDVGISYVGTAPDIGMFEYNQPDQLLPPSGFRFLSP